MLSEELKRQLKRNIESNLEMFSEKMKEILTFPYHPDTKIILFQLQVIQEAYSVTPIPLSKPFGSVLAKDQNGPVPFSVFQKMSLACNLFQGIDIEWDDELDDFDEELLEELEYYTQELFASYLSELFDKNGGQNFSIPCIFQRTDGLEAYHFQSKRWIDEEKIPSLI